MRFYDSMQMDPAGLKKMIRNSDDPKVKRRLFSAMALRSVLLVLFSMAVISPASAIFGAENSCMAVSLLCILLGIRFVDLGYRISDSMVNLAIVFTLLLVAPPAATLVHPALGTVIHISAFFVILFMTSQHPEMGNAGLYTFAYIFLSGNPVTGDAFRNRALLTAVGYAVCGGILFAKHRGKNRGIRFSDLVKDFCLSDSKVLWQLQLALGVGLILGIGSRFNLDRAMWAAFACGSILGCYNATADGVRERLRNRMAGTLIGTLAFFLAYQVVPAGLHSLFGIAGGLIVGFCADYRSKTACNCLGALFIASSIFGLHETLWLRVLHNLLGIIFGYVFWMIFQEITCTVQDLRPGVWAQDAENA